MPKKVGESKPFRMLKACARAFGTYPIGQKVGFLETCPERTLGRLRRSQYKTNCPTDLTRANTSDINE
jgi:hypothetical protein